MLVLMLPVVSRMLMLDRLPALLLMPVGVLMLEEMLVLALLPFTSPTARPTRPTRPRICNSPAGARGIYNSLLSAISIYNSLFSAKSIYNSLFSAKRIYNSPVGAKRTYNSPAGARWEGEGGWVHSRYRGGIEGSGGRKAKGDAEKRLRRRHKSVAVIRERIHTRPELGVCIRSL